VMLLVFLMAVSLIYVRVFRIGGGERLA
jgi:hypothetical protein